MSKSVQFRSIQSVELDGYSNHWGSAFQVICHILVPVRKALVHFYLNNRKNLATMEKIEWKFLSQLGSLFQQLIAAGSTEQPIDPKTVYDALHAVLLSHHPPPKKHHLPKDATEALQILLETIKKCSTTLPVTSQLWSALLDDSGLGAIAKQAIVGKKKDDGSLLQRTKRDTRILLCPFPLEGGKLDSVAVGLAQTMKRTMVGYDWDSKDSVANFEVRIPLWDEAKKKSNEEKDTPPQWQTVKTLQFDTLPNYWFLGIPRFCKDPVAKRTKEDESDSDDEGERPLLNPLVQVPMELDVGPYCVSGCQNRKFQLVGGILYDDEDYVAILKNPLVVALPHQASKGEQMKTEGPDKSQDDDNEDDEDEPLEDWNLMETDEVIPMTQEDVLEFLRGGEEGGEGGGVCGTVLVYKTTNVKALKSNDQLLSDIIISHVSGKLDTKVDFYYEEEVIED
jgi:hypothetical protein